MELLFLLMMTIGGVMAVGAIVCFYLAWHPDNFEAVFTPGRVLLIFPATIYPVVLLALHAASSEPTWKEFGEDLSHYLAKGSSAWLYITPFVAANFVVTISLIRTHFARASLLTPISLLTCILICLFFTAGNTERLFWLFPLSAASGYAYGLWLLIRPREILRLMPQSQLLLGGWFVAISATVLINITKTRDVVAKLPDEPSGCFLVTAATRGHPTIVRSSIDPATGRLSNGQLATFRSFEEWLIQHSPRTHRTVRAVYNTVAPPLARAILFRWQADVVYLILKPLEWLVRYIS